MTVNSTVIWGYIEVKTFSDFLHEMKWELGRELQDQEIEFLQWVFARYKEEQQAENEYVTSH